MKKRLSGILLSLALMLMMMPVLGLSQTAYANGEVTQYPLWVGGVQVTSENLVIDKEDSSEITGSATYDPEKEILTLEWLSYNGEGHEWGGAYYATAIYSAQDLTIQLNGNNTVNAANGKVEHNFGVTVLGKDLTITGSGTLNTNAANVGIYGTQNNITINGGTVNATGGEYGIYNYADSNGGNVTINGGTVTAKGITAPTATGISASGDVTIGDSTVTVTGKDYGIYCKNGVTINGENVEVTAEKNEGIHANNVTINGGTVYASSSGTNGSGIYSQQGKIKISGGNVTASATGNEGTGIEGQNDVEITGGTVTATGYNCGVAATNSITISNGTVIAQDADCGIGAGAGILINGGNVTAAGTRYGIATEDGVITISGGNVTAAGALAGIIAAKKDVAMNISVGINITGGKVTASGEGKAISGIVKNDVEGTGWKNVEGTEGETAIGLSSESGQFLSVYKKVSFPKPAAKVTTAPAARSLTADGTPQKLVEEGTAEGGTMQYALGNAAGAAEDYSKTIPRGTEAGDYYVWYKAAGDKTHADSEAACVKVTIAKQKTLPSNPMAVGTVHKVGTGTYVVKSAKAVWLKKPVKNKTTFTVPATVKIKGKTFSVTGINAKAFKGKKVKTLTVKTKKLTKKSVKGSLKGSKIKTVKIKVGKKKLNRKYVKKYKKIFTKKNAGRKVKIIS